MEKKRRNWVDIREWYITGNLSATPGVPVTLKDVAAQFETTYGTVRNQASKGDWNGLLKKAQDQRDDHIREGIQKRSALVQEVVQDDKINEEASVRRRQAAVSRVLQGKAAQRLRHIDPNELTIREAIDLMKLGLVEERKALGILDKYEVTARVEESPVSQIHSERARNILGKVIDLVQSKSEVYEEDVERIDDAA